MGLLVAASGSGVALGVAALMAFVARTPLKVVLVDRWRGRWLERTTLALWVALVELAALAVLVVVAVHGARQPFWVPLALAAPLFALELSFDMRSRSRRLVPELAGVAGMGAVGAAIVLAGGGVWRDAAGVWWVMATRSLAAIPSVRVQLARARHPDVAIWPSDVAQVAAVASAGVGWALAVLPAASAAVLVVVAVGLAVDVRVSPRPAVRIGVQQTVIGLTVVLVAGLAAAMP